MIEKGKFLHLALTLVFSILFTSSASADILVVSAQANIFGAGHAIAPDPGGSGGGILPPSINIASGHEIVIRFSSVTGMVSCCNGGNTFNGPDGGSHASGNTDITSYGGISGIIHNNKTMFLAGVFLGPTEPTDPAPPRLNFSGADNFLTLSPLLHQTFFIGDGLTGTGSGHIQQFIVPHGATRLFLGFADAFNFGFPVSAPGHYADNVNQLTAIFTINQSQTQPVPEPATVLLLASGLAGVGVKIRKRHKDRK